jgi:hypothetical protein
VAREEWPLIIAGLLGGAVLGAVARGIALLGRASRDAWPPAIGLGALVGLVAALAWLYARSTVTRLRVSEVTLKAVVGDVKVALDPDSRQQLWWFFIELTSRVATRELPPGDGLLEEALTSMHSLFERARADLSARPPRQGALAGTVPPHAYVLDILNQDLRPCLARWHARLDAWKRTGLPESEWPLGKLCRADIEKTRQRTVERAWELGSKAFGMAEADLGRLLPPRLDAPAVAPPAIATIDELKNKEREAGVVPDAESLKAGWLIYVETATRIATQDLPAGAGLLGEAIASLYTLFGEVRTALRAMPPARSGGQADSIEGLALSLLNEGLRPFLAEWHPRYEAFKALKKPEAEWDEAEACRVALAETRQRCLPLVCAIGKQLHAPALG